MKKLLITLLSVVSITNLLARTTEDMMTANSDNQHMSTIQPVSRNQEWKKINPSKTKKESKLIGGKAGTRHLMGGKAGTRKLIGGKAGTRQAQAPVGWKDLTPAHKKDVARYIRSLRNQQSSSNNVVEKQSSRPHAIKTARPTAQK